MKNAVYFIAILFWVSCNNSATTEAPDTNASSTTTVTTPITNVSPEEFATLMAKPNTVVLDVRTPEETAEGIIDGAITIDIQSPDFKAKVDALDKSKEYLVYCKGGVRSAKACEQMQAMGFKALYNLEGGYDRFNR
jgi:rhodanese-related sulfurtransferase